MALVPDGLYRGRHALHVYPHSKLGRHMTLINASWGLINSFIDSTSVKEVDLGRIITSKGRRDWTPCGVRTRREGRVLHLTCTSPKAVQFISVTFRVGVDLQALEAELQEKGLDFTLEPSDALHFSNLHAA